MFYNNTPICYYEDLVEEKDFSFETYIGTGKLEEGKHVLSYSRFKHPETDSVITIKEVPFFYFEN